MRVLKIAAYVAGGLIALIIVSLLLVAIFVDPNNYRADLERIVEKKSGRELNLEGELNLSVFPWIALEVGPATLGDAPGFGPEPFIAIKEARVGVRLLPLLRGKVEASNVRLVGARIRLITDEQGRDNWADLGEGEAAAEEPAPDGGTTELPTIAGLEISDAAVLLENRQEKTRRQVRDFNLKTGRLASGEPFELTTDFVLDPDPAQSVKVHLAATVTADLERNAHRLTEPEIDVTLSGQGYPEEGVPVRVRASSLDADIGRELYRLDGLKVETTWKAKGLPAAGVPLALTAGGCNVNLAAQTLELAELDVLAAGAHLSGSLTGAELLDAPKITGPLKLDQVSLREWLPKLGIDPPRTQDPAVLQKLSFAGTMTLTKSSADLGNIVLQLDDSTLQGMIGIADFDAKALRFDLNIDRINADRYLPPPSEKPAARGAQEPPAEIPVDMLRKLSARGQLVIGEAIFADLEFTELRLGVNARNGRVRFHPAEAAMYGGRYRGDIGIDATTNVARITLDEHVSGVSFAPLFKAMFETDRVSGKGSANLAVSGSGRTTDDVMKTLDGTVDFNVADGALEGADLWYEIRRARALLKRQAPPERSGPPRTTFSALTGTGVLRDGVMSNDDLKIDMQYLKVGGQGTVDIPKRALDYRLTAKVLKIPREGADPEPMQELVDAEIPVMVSGALTDPKVRPDLKGYLESQVKEKAEEKIREKLGDKLKDLFERR